MRMIPLGAGRLDKASSMANQPCGQALEHQPETRKLDSHNQSVVGTAIDKET